jgi:hypothetical protein
MLHMSKDGGRASNDGGKRVNRRLRLCVFGNCAVLGFIIALVVTFDDSDSKYWRFGPYPDLIIVSVNINTWLKYWLLVGIVGILKITQCFIAEIAHPIIGFRIYNPDLHVIKDFTKLELQFYGNAMYMIDAIRHVLMIIMSITQVDVALWGVLFSEGASLFTIRMLLNEKSFEMQGTDYKEMEEMEEMEGPAV